MLTLPHYYDPEGETEVLWVRCLYGPHHDRHMYIRPTSEIRLARLDKWEEMHCDTYYLHRLWRPPAGTPQYVLVWEGVLGDSRWQENSVF